MASQPPWINIDHQFSVNCLSPCIQARTDGSRSPGGEGGGGGMQGEFSTNTKQSAYMNHPAPFNMIFASFA